MKCGQVGNFIFNDFFISQLSVSDHLRANEKAKGGRFIHLLLIAVLFQIDLRSRTFGI